MTLILTVRNSEALEAGTEASYSVEGDMAVIGRSRNCDWNLPDASNVVSSRHCEIRRDGDSWLLKDISTNGTFLNDAAERLADEHRIAEGDLIRIGPYELVASFGEAKTQFMPRAGEPEPRPLRAPEPAGARARAGRRAERRTQVPDNVTVMWDSLADINKVDWARGGFGVERRGAGRGAGGTVDEIVRSLIEAAALAETEVERSPETVAKAGALLKRLVAGLLVMVEARARAKAQMGAEMTGLAARGQQPDQVRPLARSGAGAIADAAAARLHGGRQGGRGRLSRPAVAPGRDPEGDPRRAPRDARPLLARLGPPPRRDYAASWPSILPALPRRRALAQLRARICRGEEGIRRSLHGGVRQGIPQGL